MNIPNLASRYHLVLAASSGEAAMRSVEAAKKAESRSIRMNPPLEGTVVAVPPLEKEFYIQKSGYAIRRHGSSRDKTCLVRVVRRCVWERAWRKEDGGLCLSRFRPHAWDQRYDE